MRETGERSAGPWQRLPTARPRLVAQARLFVFLTLLGPLFGALHAMIEEGVPKIEVQFVPRTVMIEVPVEVVVERIVDRLVFVPVPTATLHPWTQTLWNLSRWNLSRLPRAGGVTASAAGFPPAPSTPRASLFAQPDPALPAGGILAGAPPTPPRALEGG